MLGWSHIQEAFLEACRDGDRLVAAAMLRELGARCREHDGWRRKPALEGTLSKAELVDQLWQDVVDGLDLTVAIMCLGIILGARRRSLILGAPEPRLTA